MLNSVQVYVSVVLYLDGSVWVRPHCSGNIWILIQVSLCDCLTLSLWCHHFRKAPFLKCFPSTPKGKSSVFKFLRFEERFRKAPFSWWFSVDGRPSRRNKAAFSDCSGLNPSISTWYSRFRGPYVSHISVLPIICNQIVAWSYTKIFHRGT